ncbi:hypothetical protein MJA45_17535 [Paenibacillus aurantius]|uniref:WYL domain-containing protein n=1 Tax=Paenibacillus aurantius TaxID=2918900 RepID=A0AA96L9D2_9BACL|nr:hypothetical protein [Paenibacillus aurantius]WNQ09426.1 hypothetical protein MJA45_17535 [Paenibacillus aurantius]
MDLALDQFMGEPVNIIYLDSDNRTVQHKIDILTTGAQCCVAYCFDRQEAKLFRNNSILAVMPIKKYYH